uniref:Uncharacterized protein n=1 Tax=Oreochromis niloticus TaxID=8128 RepID=A0A669DN87_ORENI
RVRARSRSPSCFRSGQCTIDRYSIRKELDSWPHKLIQCVGFESILEGLFGSALVEDLKLFKGKCLYETIISIIWVV